MAKTKTKRSRLPAGIKEIDGRYHVRVTVTDPVTTKRVERKRLLDEGATLAEAVALREELRSGALEEAQETHDELIGAFVRSWIARKARKWRKKTADTWLYRLEHHILPFWEDVAISEISRRLVQRWRDLLQEQIGEYAEGTVRGWWTYGLQLLRDALAEHELRDCTQRVDPPSGSTAPRRELRTLSREEIGRLVEAFRARSRHWIVVAVAAYTGCRMGEALALRWCDVDLEAGVIRIERSCSATLGGVQWTSPKSGKAREAGIPPVLRRLLEEHRTEQPGLGEALISRTARGNPPPAGMLRRSFHHAAKAAGIDQRVGFQTLRRSCNSLGLEAGVDHEVLRASIGHADAAMTRHYHGVRSETLARMAAQVWPADVACDEVEADGGRQAGAKPV